MGGNPLRTVIGIGTGGLSENYYLGRNAASGAMSGIGGLGEKGVGEEGDEIKAIQAQFAKDVLAGKIPPAFRTGIENQYNVAKNQAMDFLPRGGQLDSALLGLNQARAESIGTLPAQLLPIAFGALGQSQQANALEAQAQAQKKQGTGQALGKITAAAIGSCWIAAELYGYGSAEFYAARHWIFDVWDGPVARMTQAFYLKYGQRMAGAIHRYPILKPIIRPLFDMAVRRGKWAT